MKAVLFILLLCCSTASLYAQRTETWSNQVFKIDTLASAMSFPWEITYGPDDSIWVTESRNYRVVKIHPGNKGRRTILNLSSSKNFNRPDATGGQWPQGGLMGLAVHPQLLEGKPYVYLAYVYQWIGCGSNNSGCIFRTRLVRYTYNTVNGSLANATTILDALPGSNDHNSGRLTIGPDLKLYYTIGDMGAGQFNNLNRPNNAQVKHIYEGKILRLNTEPDDDALNGADPYNRWIPNDNPFTHPVSGFRLATYSTGHRNPQGIVWGKRNGTDILYSDEHGDKSDDEVNIIEAGANYGWPFVAGKCDNNYSIHDAYANNNSLAGRNIGYEDTFCVSNNVREPMFGLFTVPAAQIPSGSSGIFTWPTVAPSGLDYYNAHAIPGWNNSLLITSLKYGMFRLKLKNSGMAVDSSSTPEQVDTIPYFHGYRVRDITMNPGGDTLYLAIDSSGNTSGPTGGFGTNVSAPTAERGNILRVVYMSTLALSDHRPTNPDRDKSALKIYPNPARGSIHVELERGTVKPVRVQLFDMAGRVMMDQTTNKDNFTINTSALKPGVYALRIYNGYRGLIRTEKVIIR